MPGEELIQAQAFIFGCRCTLIIGTFLTLTGWWDFASHHTLLTVTHSGIGWIAEVLRFAVQVARRHHAKRA